MSLMRHGRGGHPIYAETPSTNFNAGDENVDVFVYPFTTVW